MKAWQLVTTMLLAILLVTGCRAQQQPLATISPSAAPFPSSSPDDARLALSSMTVEEKVGQMFFVRCNEQRAVADVEQYHLGGLILFAEDTKNETKEGLALKLRNYQNSADIGLLIGTDEEGGTVNRLSRYPAFRKAPFHSPQSLFQEGGLELVRSDTKEKAELLTSLGINVNLAPVADVSTNPKDFIYPRSFGADAEQTSEYVKTVVETMNENNLGCTLKHFPGYGNNRDTHKGSATDNRPLSTFETSDFLPFRAGIEAGAGSVLVSHNIVTAIDPERPASLSPAVHSILRNELAFNGVVMTDDLLMDAVRDYAGDQAAAILAVEAGNDLLIASDYTTQIPAVIEAVQSGRIPESRLDESALRILYWKQTLGLF